LLKRAYGELAKNEVFAKALKDSGDEPLSHSVGKRNMRETVLTEGELIRLLTDLRDGK
jgi:hypothetical protein